MRLAPLALVLALTLPAAAADDPRTPIDLPPDIKALFLEEMRTHMVSLDTVVQFLAAGKTKEAGAYARKEMAIGQGHGIGRYMPPEFREMGWGFHRTAEDFARIADKLPATPDAAGWVELMGGLSAITASCSGCHGAFRVK